jgi:hypothetical protein
MNFNNEIGLKSELILKNQWQHLLEQAMIANDNGLPETRKR